MNETIKPNPSKYIPDPRLHLIISLIKSVLRIGAGVALVYSEFFTSGALLITAEILGIAEELV